MSDINKVTSRKKKIGRLDVSHQSYNESSFLHSVENSQSNTPYSRSPSGKHQFGHSNQISRGQSFISDGIATNAGDMFHSLSNQDRVELHNRLTFYKTNLHEEENAASLFLSYIKNLRSLMGTQQGIIVIDPIKFDKVITERSEIISKFYDELMKNKSIKSTSTVTEMIEDSFGEYLDLYPNAIGKGFDILIGHSSSPFTHSVTTIDLPIVGFIKLETPVNFNAKDGYPTKFVWIIYTERKFDPSLEKLIDAIGFLSTDSNFNSNIWELKNEKDVLDSFDKAISEIEKDVELYNSTLKLNENAEEIFFHNHDLGEPFLPKNGDLSFISPGRSTDGLFSAMFREVKGRIPHYKSDIIDGLNFKTLAAAFFLFFACATPTVTFGALMAEATDDHIGVGEAFIGTLLCGVFFTLTSCQPLVILGTTGPLLVFTIAIAQIAKLLDITFFSLYSWTGIWMALICIIVSVTNSCKYIMYFNSFSDEIFSALIALVFLIDPWVKNFLRLITNPDSTDDVILLSVVLLLGTFFLCKTFKAFRNSKYLYSFLREGISDLGPVLALVIMTGFKYIFGNINVELLLLPDGITPSMEGRSWFVNPWLVPSRADNGDIVYEYVDWQIIMGAIIPGFMGAILIFLDTNITGRIVNHPRNRLKKPFGLNWDFFIISLLLLINTLFGLPWFYAATVRTMNHMMALSVKMEKSNGTTTEVAIVKVYEQRISGIVIHLAVGGILFMTEMLNKLPVFCLLGVFMYMGYAALKDNPLIDRIFFLFSETASYPPDHFARLAPSKDIYSYTFIQILLVGVLYCASEGSEWHAIMSWIALSFPLQIALLVPFYEYFMRKWYNENILDVFDIAD